MSKIERSAATSDLIQRVREEFENLSPVVALGLGGSQASGALDDYSDLDFYVYTSEAIAPDLRASIAKNFSPKAEINNQFWEPGDEWIDRQTGLGVDIMYRSPGWIEDQLERLLVRHEASIGYSTCLWHNLRSCQNLYDPTGWFGRLQEKAEQPYPEQLRQAIIAKNYPILRNMQSSYYHQIEKSLRRRDLVSYNHRLAALLASYFDIIFALNYQLHPGEKRLVALSKKLCARLPANFEANINDLMAISPTPENSAAILAALDRLLNELDALQPWTS